MSKEDTKSVYIFPCKKYRALTKVQPLYFAIKQVQIIFKRYSNQIYVLKVLSFATIIEGVEIHVDLLAEA